MHITLLDINKIVVFTIQKIILFYPVKIYYICVISHLWTTGGAQRTPVKQKMKTMSRSLQMLNVAWLNVKAQKNQTEDEQQVAEGKGAGRAGKRQSSDKNKSGTGNAIGEYPQWNFTIHLIFFLCKKVSVYFLNC